MRTLNKYILPLVLILNCIHILLPFEYTINSGFNSTFSIISLALCLILIKKISNLVKDRLVVFTLVVSVITQNISNQVNRGVPDYFNLYLFKSNIPDVLIFLSLLTWWYYRVYKSPKLLSAK